MENAGRPAQRPVRHMNSFIHKVIYMDAKMGGVDCVIPTRITLFWRTGVIGNS